MPRNGVLLLYRTISEKLITSTHSVLNSQKSGFWGWGGLGKVRSRREAPNKLRQIGAKRQRKYEESARSAEEKVRSWRGAPKRRWGVGMKRRRESEELARSAKENMRSQREVPKRRWGPGAKRQREYEEIPCETLIMKIICCFLPDIIIKNLSWLLPLDALFDVWTQSHQPSLKKNDGKAKSVETFLRKDNTYLKFMETWMIIVCRNFKL